MFQPMQQFQQFQQAASQMKQVLQAPNQLEALKRMVANNPQAKGLLNQLEALTPEQRENKLKEITSQIGILPNQLKNFLGM